jgi:outer membrane protein assembly factor BamB
MFGDERSGGVLLFKTDNAGHLLWHRVFGGDDFDIGWSIHQTADGELLIAGQTASFGTGGMDGYLIKVDQHGNELWSRSIGSDLDEEISTVLEALGGGYFLVGNQVDPNDFITDPGEAGYGGFGGRSNPYLVRIDDNGNEIWSRTLESPDNIMATSGSVTPDGGLVLLVTVLHYPSFGEDAALIKVDDNGNELWSRAWTEDSYSGNTFVGAQEGSWLFSGTFETEEHPVSDLFLIQTDPYGNELWRQYYGDPDVWESGHAILETKDGNLLLLASTTDNLFSGRSEILLVKTDDTGNLLWEKRIELFVSSKAHAIQQHRDGGYLITGSTSGYDGAPRTFLLKTDREGNVRDEIESVPLP